MALIDKTSLKILSNFNLVCDSLHKELNQTMNYFIVDRKLNEDTYLVKDFDEDTIRIRMINIDIYDKFKYYGVSIN